MTNFEIFAMIGMITIGLLFLGIMGYFIKTSLQEQD